MALQSEVNARTETAEEHTSDPLIHGTKQMFTQVQNETGRQLANAALWT